MSENNGRIINIEIEDQLKKAYLEYSMSVNLSRAIPDIRDGLKPSQRRILYAMHELHLGPKKHFRKCAKIAGDTSGNYHPHGEMVVYPTLVRMAQPWNMRYPLINGQGNFGSIDGDPPAAMRYTEAKLQKISMDFLGDLEKDTVDFQENYDGTNEEPQVFPTKFPNLLLNGSSGIGVGLATNMAPHNITEICNAIIATVDNPEIEPLELMEYIKGPDFPTRGKIIGDTGIKKYFQTGKGKVKVRGKADIIENDRKNDQIIISEIPFQVAKNHLIEKIASLVKDKRIPGISDIKDESGRKGMRLVIFVKRGHEPEIVLKKLYKYSQLQTTFSVSNLSVVGKTPKVLNIKEMINHHIKFRHEVIIRRTKFELKKAEAKLHILEGYRIALDNIDEIIKIIKESEDVANAKTQLQERFGLSEIQATEILKMQLRRLTGLQREKIEQEYKETFELVQELKEILASREFQMNILKEETQEMIDMYGDERRTEILPDQSLLTLEQLIPEEDMLINITHAGYVKRLSMETYKQQKRGGKGLAGGNLRENDFVESIFIASTHAYILFFTNHGKCHWLKVHEIPKASRKARGKAIVNLLDLQKTEKVKAFSTVKVFDESSFIVIATEKGRIKKTKLSAFSRPRKSGIYAVTLKDGDKLIDAQISKGYNDIFLATKNGYSNRFHENQIRPMGRTAQGVKGISLRDNDKVVSLVVHKREGSLLTISENGYGKRSHFEDYRKTKRGSKGVISLKTTMRNGHQASLMEVIDGDELMIVTKEGMIIRQEIDRIKIIGRNTQGVRLINLKNGDKVYDIALIKKDENDEENENETNENSEKNKETESNNKE